MNVLPDKTKTEFFYGYIVVIAAFIIMMVSFGLFSSYGVFFTPLLTEFGWTRAITSGAFSLNMILQGVLGAVMGGLTDRFGPRMVLTLCGFLLGLGYLLMSQVSALWHLYLFFGVMIGIGQAGIWVPLLSSVTRWFVRRRNLMTGIVVAASGAGGFIAPPVITRLIAIYDWRLSCIMLGGAVLLSTVIAAQFLRRDPAQVGQLPYGENEVKQSGVPSETEAFTLREAVYTTQFWLVFIIFFCRGYFIGAIIVHIIPYAIELAISAISAANILAIILGIGILGNFVPGSIGDRLSARHFFIIGFILISVTLFCLVPAKEVWILYVCAVIFGLARGGMSTSEVPLVASFFGLSSLGLIFGIICLGFTAGAAVGPFVTGYIFDITGGYQMAFWLCGACSVVGLIATAILRPIKKLNS